MLNPIMQMLSKPSNNQILEQAKSLMNSNNPIIGMVRMMTAGKDPQKVFYLECQRRGINPQDILNLLK